MITLKKGRQIGSFKIDHVTAKNKWRTAYRVLPAWPEKGPGEILYSAYVYDLEAVPAYSMWVPEEGSGEVAVPLEMHFLNGRWTAMFPFAEEKGVDGRYAWIVIREPIYAKLEYMLGSDENIFTFSDCMDMAIALCSAVEQVRYFDKKGEACHFNINPFTVLYDPENDINRHIWLEGFENMAYPHSGHIVPRMATEASLYMAPEMFSGEYTERADVFAICLLLYQLVMDGEYPWPVPMRMRQEITMGMVTNQEYSQFMERIWSQPLRLRDFLTDSLKHVLRKGLSINPADRYESVRKLRTAFESTLVMYTALVTATEEMEEEEKKMEKEEKKDDEVKVCNSSEGFSELAGMQEFKEAMTDKFVLPFKNMELAAAYGLNLPNGVLLYGPPGNGKSYCVQHLAGEVGIPYQVLKPSDLGSIYIHGSQGKIRDIFEEAKKYAPVILAFDEADAMVPGRNIPDNEHYAGETNEFLTQLNDAAKGGVFVFLLSNRPERIDAAILRRGRVDEKIFIPLPDERAREEFFVIRLEKMAYVGEMDYRRLAVLTEGRTFADLDYIVNEAGRRAFRRSLDKPGCDPVLVTMELLESVITEAGSSVSEADIRHFEMLKEQFDNKYRGVSRRKIGYPGA